jgi:isoaspartyl peptidase/L-asparaginase-like protein (Ntn-hydrolase superfamily)
MNTQLVATLALELLTQAVKLMQRHNVAVAAGEADIPDEEIRDELDAAILKLELLNAGESVDGTNELVS